MRYYNRDVLSTTNMVYIIKHLMTDGVRPSIFIRPTQEEFSRAAAAKEEKRLKKAANKEEEAKLKSDLQDYHRELQNVVQIEVAEIKTRLKNFQRNRFLASTMLEKISKLTSDLRIMKENCAEEVKKKFKNSREERLKRRQLYNRQRK